MMKIKKKLIFSGVIFALIGIIGCGSNNNSNSESVSLAQWYARTTVSAVNPDTQTIIKHKTAGVFGQLYESSDEKDPHDIIGMGTESATLEVVFPQNEWDNDNGDYFSDYHSLKEGSDSWTFQVKNMYNPDRPVDLSNEAITIALDGLYIVESTIVDGSTHYTEKLNRTDKRLEELTLIDLDNKVAYTLSELPNAEITMDGMHTRTFKWVLGEVTETDYEPLTTSVAARSMSLKSMPVSSKTMSDSKFGLPPQ